MKTRKLKPFSKEARATFRDWLADLNYEESSLIGKGILGGLDGHQRLDQKVLLLKLIEGTFNRHHFFSLSGLVYINSHNADPLIRLSAQRIVAEVKKRQMDAWPTAYRFDRTGLYLS